MSLSNGLEKYPKLRFPGYSKPWNHEKLSDFTTRIVRKNKNNETTLPLTISSKDGLVDQVSFFNKAVASKDMSGYYLIRNGEFAYNKSYSVGYDFGSIKRLDRYPMGALSTLYICFELNKHNSDFVKTYFDSLKWYKEIYLISAVGARNHGLLNIPTEDFFNSLHYIPSGIEEQEKIANFLMLIDKKIQKQQQLVELLKKYKKGLFDKIFEENKSIWETGKLGEYLIVQRGGSPRPIDEFLTNEENGINWIKIGDVSEDSRYITSTKEKIKPSGVKKSRPVYKGDLILSNSMSFGRPYILQIDGCIHDGWLVIRDENNMFDKEYLLQLLSSDYMYRQYKSLAAGGVVNNLNSELVQSTKILIPSFEEQKRVGNIFSTYDEKINITNKELQELKLMKQSLLQQLFI